MKKLKIQMRQKYWKKWIGHLKKSLAQSKAQKKEQIQRANTNLDGSGWHFPHFFQMEKET